VNEAAADKQAGADKLHRRLVLVFGLIGLAVSIYLVFIKLTSASALCMGLGDCEAVNNSIYSELFGIPIAVFGALTYAAILALALLESKIELVREWGPVAEFGLGLFGTLYSAYLTYIELFVLHKICPYCVTSAIAITIICIVAGMRLRRVLG
jgi:uncharacterized membrane protein